MRHEKHYFGHISLEWLYCSEYHFNILLKVANQLLQENNKRYFLLVFVINYVVFYL